MRLVTEVGFFILMTITGFYSFDFRVNCHVTTGFVRLTLPMKLLLTNVSITASWLINIQAFFGVYQPRTNCCVGCDNVIMSYIVFGSVCVCVGEDRMSSADTHLDCPHCRQHLHLFGYTQCKHQSHGHF